MRIPPVDNNCGQGRPACGALRKPVIIRRPFATGDSMSMALHVVILAAGQGTRMKSARPKVLQPLAGRPLLAHVLGRALGLGAHATHVVYGHGGDAVPAAFPDSDVRWVLQAQQLGTGHAVAQAMPGIPDDATVLVLYGDVPLIEAATLKPLVTAARDGRLALLGVRLEDPTGYGRLIRDAAGRVVRIVEQKDASPAELAVTEVNTGSSPPRPAACAPGWPGCRTRTPRASTTSRTSSRRPWRTASRWRRCSRRRSRRCSGSTTGRSWPGWRPRCGRIAGELMAAGVTLVDPARIDVRGRLDCGRDVIIDVNAVFEGVVELGDDVSIGPNVLIRDSRLGAGCVVHANTSSRARTSAPAASSGRSPACGPARRARRGRQDRQFRRAQEKPGRRRQQGEPPQLRRRCRDWDARQRRRGHDHVQLRRRQQAPHGDRRRRLHRLEHGAGGAGRDRRRRDHRRGLDDLEGCAGRRADGGTRAASR
jgi:bifunctional UDP-N-acetylglucosamine pyrophosphorylase / glucosamine-1-phosphate N-acetyltransferase